MQHHDARPKMDDVEPKSSRNYGFWGDVICVHATIEVRGDSLTGNSYDRPGQFRRLDRQTCGPRRTNNFDRFKQAHVASRTVAYY